MTVYKTDSFFIYHTLLYYGMYISLYILHVDLLFDLFMELIYDK